MKAAKYITLLIAAVLFTSTVSAQGYGKGQRRLDSGGPHWGEGRMMEKLDLSDEQKEKMKEIRTEALKEMQPVKNTLQEKRAKMHTLQTAENVDMNAINNLIDEMAGLRTTMQKTRAANHQKIRSLLTEDQRVLFDSMPKNGPRGFGHRGKGNRGGQGGQRCFQ